ncbi:hypothetical protein E2P81_ATG05413 [Venturia nashicola]|nr:hypothetical protein E2P81_ATG05413 [Venturia nashicola]
MLPAVRRALAAGISDGPPSSQFMIIGLDRQTSIRLGNVVEGGKWKQRDRAQVSTACSRPQPDSRFAVHGVTMAWPGQMAGLDITTPCTMHNAHPPLFVEYILLSLLNCSFALPLSSYQISSVFGHTDARREKLKNHSDIIGCYAGDFTEAARRMVDPGQYYSSARSGVGIHSIFGSREFCHFLITLKKSHRQYIAIFSVRSCNSSLIRASTFLARLNPSGIMIGASENVLYLDLFHPQPPGSSLTLASGPHRLTQNMPLQYMDYVVIHCIPVNTQVKTVIQDRGCSSKTFVRQERKQKGIVGRYHINFILDSVLHAPKVSIIPQPQHSLNDILIYQKLAFQLPKMLEKAMEQIHCIFHVMRPARLTNTVHTQLRISQIERPRS